LSPLCPEIRTVIADAGHESRKLARQLLPDDGWKLQIVKRRQRAFKITGLTWIVERSSLGSAAIADSAKTTNTCSRHRKPPEIAEQYLQEHPRVRGLFLILVGRCHGHGVGVQRSKQGAICNLEAKRAFINHYSFHIIDPDWGHITIKMAGHPLFGAQIILNGHEYVACQARCQKLGFTKEGNCFTIISKPAELAKVADTLSESRTVGRLSQLCERWIYSSCLCFALSLEEQKRTRFRYGIRSTSSSTAGT
jgi:hypothetical protein